MIRLRAARDRRNAEPCLVANGIGSISALNLAQRTALAGALAGMVSFLTLHPLDTIKTVRQSSPRATSGILATAAFITRERGWRGLYAGAIPAALGAAPSSAIYFATYESTKAFLFGRCGGASDAVDGIRVPIHLTAAACGNLASSVLFVPKEVIKQRLQSGYASNAVAVVLKLKKERGLSALFHGFRASLLRNIPSNALKFVIYEEIKQVLRRTAAVKTGGAVSHGRELSGFEHWIAGAIAGMTASAVTTPMDVLKTRLATQHAHGSRSLVRLATTILREEGPVGLYVGFRSRVLLAALFSAVGLGSYELFRKKLMPPETAPRFVEKVAHNARPKVMRYQAESLHSRRHSRRHICCAHAYRLMRLEQGTALREVRRVPSEHSLA
mmetsp:Transcript_9933/g.26418  ORF Transcript_9933/g.26418 Transcript_9933/m.26418 type:complete len:385 (-) Transcript_9933:800-1954(-)